MDIRSKGNRIPGFYLRTQVGMNGPVILGRASRTPLPYGPSHPSGFPMMPPLSSVLPCPRAPSSTCQLVFGLYTQYSILDTPTSHLCTFLPTHSLALALAGRPCQRVTLPTCPLIRIHPSSSLPHLHLYPPSAFNAPPPFHLITFSLGHRLRPDPPQRLALGIGRRHL